MSQLEIAANIVNLLSVFLANRNNIHTWWTGIIGSILYGIMFFEVRLYADVTLQIFFIVTGIWGWWNWIHGGSQKKELPITRVALPRLILFIIISIAVTAGYGYLLFYQTDASYPFTDSVVLVFSVLAQLLLMERKLESWIFWILVDAIAVPLYASKELYLTSAVYFVFLILAILGLLNWLKIWRSSELSIELK